MTREFTGAAQVQGTAHMWCHLGSATATVTATPTVEATAFLSGGELLLKISAVKAIAALRALRTLIQGIAAAFPAAGAGIAVLHSTCWQTFGYSCLAALIAALVSFLQNVAGILPEDPTQQRP